MTDKSEEIAHALLLREHRDALLRLDAAQIRAVMRLTRVAASGLNGVEAGKALFVTTKNEAGEHPRQEIPARPEWWWAIHH